MAKRFIKRVPTLMWGCLLLLAVFVLFANNYLRPQNITNILKNSSMLMIVSCGMAITIISKQIDVSIGGVMTFSGMVAAMYLTRVEQSAGQIALAFAIGTAVGLAFGLFNGIMIGKYKYNYWLVTFATMSIGYGAAQAINGGYLISGFSSEFRSVVNRELLFLPAATWIAIAIIAIMAIVTYKTRFGKYIYAVGDSEQCALNSGVNVVKTRVLIYCISGALAGFAGVLLVAKTNSAGPTTANGYEFDAIAAVIIGGTSFEGGKGGVIGSVAGALIMTAILNGLQLMGVNSYWQQVLMGVFILVIITIDVISGRVKQKNQQRRIYKNG